MNTTTNETADIRNKTKRLEQLKKHRAIAEEEITNDNDFYKALAQIRDYLKSKTKENSVSLEIASACNHLFLIKEKI